MIDRIANGRTDLVFDHIAAGKPANASDKNGVSLIQWCAYYGDVSAIRFLLANGEKFESLGEKGGLNGAAFHGHWQLCQFLIEKGADVNQAHPGAGETPLHAALSASHRPAHENVIRVLLAKGANPNIATKPGVPTDAFMRDSRTRGETPFHRAAAFACETTIQLLLDAGGKLDAKDMNGDTPLAWASWHRRPDSILKLLCYGNFSIPAGRRTMEESLRGAPKL